MNKPPESQPAPKDSARDVLVQLLHELESAGLIKLKKATKDPDHKKEAA